jgi:hypothetical protein
MHGPGAAKSRNIIKGTYFRTIPSFMVGTTTRGEKDERLLSQSFHSGLGYSPGAETKITESDLLASLRKYQKIELD